MDQAFVQALIIAFREGLEAFLIIAILLNFLNKTDNKKLKPYVWYGLSAGLIFSVLFGLILMELSSFMGGTESTAKLWESMASLVATLLITTFILWMIKHGGMLKEHVENQTALNLSEKGLFLLSLFMVAREGAELAIFSFAGKYSVLPIFVGVSLSSVMVVLIYYSLVSIKLRTLLTITLVYLILQAGFLIGYSIHEALSALKDLGIIEKENLAFSKPFDFSDSVLDHKKGIAGVPMYILVGWYSKPEWIQFIVQYVYTLSLFAFWYLHEKKSRYDR